MGNHWLGVDFRDVQNFKIMDTTKLYAECLHQLEACASGLNMVQTKITYLNWMGTGLGVAVVALLGLNIWAIWRKI